MKCTLLCVADISKISRHNAIKHIVDRIEDFLSASEILVKLNFFIASLPALIRLIGIIFLEKQFRSRKAKAVNALLDVSNHKDIVATETLPGHRF